MVADALEHYPPAFGHEPGSARRGVRQKFPDERKQTESMSPYWKVGKWSHCPLNVLFTYEVITVTGLTSYVQGTKKTKSHLLKINFRDIFQIS